MEKDYNTINGLVSLRETEINCRMHINSELEIVFVHSGKLTVHLGSGRSVILLENQATVILPYRLHGFETHDNASVTVYMFSNQLSYSFFCSYHNKRVKNDICILDDATLRYIKAATDGIRNETANIYLVKSLLYTFFSCYVQDNVFTEMSGDEVLVNRIIEYIYSCIDGEITSDEIAKEFRINHSQINDVFLDYVGLKFKDFVNSIRIERAINLLNNKNMNITEIAYSCGFESIRTFNRIFMKHTGYTPSEFRRK